MDLCATSSLLLTPEMGVQLVESDYSGPLPPNSVGLLLGRSSVALRGLVIIPGVIDSDFLGKIKIMVQAPQGAILINAGDRIAQLLLLPSLHSLFPAKNAVRSNGGFGSSGNNFTGLHMLLHERPTLNLQVNGKTITGLLDTGADKSIIATKDWPNAWPTNVAEQTLQGLGFASFPKKSATLLSWWDEEGHTGQFAPFVLPLPISLWGRDVLTEMDIALTTASPTVQSMLHKQGYVPGKGLGIRLQGNPSPIQPKPKQDKTGLGFS